MSPQGVIQKIKRFLVKLFLWALELVPLRDPRPKAGAVIERGGRRYRVMADGSWRRVDKR